MQTSSNPSELIASLNKGKICIFETDTVVGIACTPYLNNNTLLNDNINRIFNIKKRSLDKPLP